MSTPRIKPVENGPLLVSGVEQLRNAAGRIEASGDFALCRCGESASKPFCDGAHARRGFSSSRREDRTEDRRDDYVGERITIHDDRGLCAHAGVCTDRLPSVWRLGQEPWIDPDGAPADEVAAVARACPSGALGYSRHEDQHADQESAPSILVAPDGPYVVSGGLELEGEASRARCTLCRCGASGNKPFCDGSHWSVGFQDEGNR